MSSLQSIVGTLTGYIIYFAALLLTIVLLVVLMELINGKHGLIRIFLMMLHLLIAFFLLVFLLDYSYNTLIKNRIEILPAFEFKLLILPWLLYMIIEFYLAIVVCLNVSFLHKIRKSHLTSDAIRQAVDRLPTALMISEADGTVLLANLKMSDLCQKLTGELLSDAKRFWNHIINSSVDLLIHTNDKETWQFSREKLNLDGQEYDQIVAADMTKQYRITQELSQKNQYLREVQGKLTELAEKERNLAAEREIMNARMTVHNRMGAVLLSGKYYLDHPENVKEEELLQLLKFSNSFLIDEAEEKENDIDPLKEAQQTADRIGVKVTISGESLLNKETRNIIAQAIDQCATNTVRHAAGDLLDVVIRENDSEINVSFTNNGDPPQKEITETGGLAVLRKSVESAGGSMNIQSQPTFLLDISFPK